MKIPLKTFADKSGRSWQVLQFVVMDTIDAYFRDGACIFLAMKGVGQVEVQRQRALSVLWAATICMLGSYVAFTTDGGKAPYLGGPYWYW